jgi:outer membrane protein assembly complex protein YaeT
MRRFLQVCGTLAVVVVVALAVLPWWLGAFLTLAGRPLGLEFAEYKRLGYTRFALEEAVFDQERVRVTAARVEVDSPVVLLFRPWSGRKQPALITTWEVTVKPDDTVVDESKRGAVKLRERLLRIAKHLDRWLPVAEVGAGSVAWEKGDLTIGSAIWNQRALEVAGLHYGQLATGVKATFAKSGVIDVDASPPDGPWRLTANWDDEGARGDVGIWEQVATFSAKFTPGKWLPESASIAAPGWNLPGSRVRLGKSYESIRGDARLQWETGRFETTIDLAGEPVADSDAPPLTAKLRGHGDTHTAVVESLFIEIPGVNAKLSAPVEIDRRGRIQSGASEFLVAVDFEKQPWIEARGSANGSARIIPRGGEEPLIEASLEGTEMAWRDWRASKVEATGSFDWPELELTVKASEESTGAELSARGKWDFNIRELLDAHARGTLTRESSAHLPKGVPEFRTVTFTADAHGSFNELVHSGKLEVSELAIRGLNSLEIETEWEGKGTTARVSDAHVRAGDSEVFFSAEIEKDRMNVEALRFLQSGIERLVLKTPAFVQWSPRVEVGSVELVGDDSSLGLSAVWGMSGKVHIAARNIPSDWLADFARTRDLQWEIWSLNVDGTWDEGPVSFETTGAFVLNIGDNVLADIQLNARSDGDEVVIESLRVSKEETPIFSSSGTLPVSLHPGTERLVRIKADGPLQVSTSSTSSPRFWEEFKELTGVELVDPEAKLELFGTWSKPQGSLRATATRVSVDNERIKFAMPEIEALEIDATADQERLSLDRLTLLVAGQTVRATGRMPLGRENWENLSADPVAFLRNRADLHLEIPNAEVAALSAYAPAFLSTEGQLQLDANMKSGGEIEGFLRMQGASTRPLGPLGVLQQISADLRFSGRSIELRELVATSGGQPVTLSGHIELPANAPPLFDVRLEGSNLPLVRRTGLLLRGDVDLRLTSEEGGVPLISGEAQLRDSLYFSDIRDLIPRGGGGVSGRPPYFSVEVEPFDKWHLAVGVQGERFMRLRTAVFNGTLSTRFQVSGTLGDPRAIGEATVDEGRLMLPFATFAVQHGSARLTEDDPFEPRLALAGESRLQGIDVRVELKGTATQPELTFNSSPPLGSDVLLGMVMAGLPASREGTDPGSRRYARLGTYVGQGILRNLSPDTGDSDRLSISSGSNISVQGRETYDIEYRMRERFSLVGEYDEYDEFNSGVKWRFLRDRRKTAMESEEETPDGERARIRVNGLGWLGNWEQRRSLERLLQEQVGETLDANGIEDAAILLLSAVADEGFKDAEIELELTTSDGSERRLTLDSTFSTPLPRPLEVTSVVFHVKRGERQFVGDVSISGLTAIPIARARGFFRPTPFLLATEGSRPHTQSRMTRAIDRLREELNKLGYVEAEVSAEKTATDSGRVSLAITVTEGPRWQVRSIRVSGADQFGEKLSEIQKHAALPWSRRWQQDVREAARRIFYEEGYPDAGVAISHGVGEIESGVKPVDVTVAITPGEQVKLGEVRIEGAESTRASVIRRRIASKEGDLFNPILLERSRYRLTRLGIFESVDMRIEPGEGPVRNAVFALKESRQWGAAALFGYGTYERLRVGLEVSKRNLFGLAHQGRLELIKSMKSTRGELSYTVPELFGESVDGTARVFGLEREEISFLRNEFGVNIALRRPIRAISGEASVGYTFQSLQSTENELSTAPTDIEDVIVGSIDFAVLSDWRDSPLRPRKGASLYGRLEVASQAFGGESDFQRLVIGGSVHTSLGTGRWLHFALSHGVVTTQGSENDLLLPVNKRFFPGGDGSIRGYKSGEAAPRGEDGKFIGAKSYLRAGIEVEQALTESLSIVAFLDALGSAPQLEDYPFEESLFSAGALLRFHTIVGPIQLGYGHNLNPRVDDPSGTLFFSIGFPF